MPGTPKTVFHVSSKAEALKKVGCKNLLTAEAIQSKLGDGALVPDVLELISSNNLYQYLGRAGGATSPFWRLCGLSFQLESVVDSCGMLCGAEAAKHLCANIAILQRQA